jgi:hypothetical protein
VIELRVLGRYLAFLEKNCMETSVHQFVFHERPIRLGNWRVLAKAPPPVKNYDFATQVVKIKPKSIMVDITL